MKHISKQMLGIGLALSVFAAALIPTALASGTTETMMQDNSAAELSDKWVGNADGSAVVTLDTTDKLGAGNAAKIDIDRSKNEYAMGTVSYNYETNVTGSDGFRFRACADSAMTLRVAFVFDWEKQRYADVQVGTEPRIYTIRWEDTSDYGGPFDVAGKGHFTQVIFQNGRTASDPQTNVLYLDELKYFVGDDASSLSGTVLPATTSTTAQPDVPDTGKATVTMMQDNSAAELSDKWVGNADGSAVVTLDTTDKLGAGNAAKIDIDRSKNEYALGTVRYDYMTDVTGSDGFRFVACAEKPMTLRVAFVFDWEKQRYADVQIGTEPRVYTIRWEDGAMYDGVAGFDVAGKGHFTQVIFQNGRTASDPQTNVLYLDELQYFTGDAATNLVGSKPVKEEPAETTTTAPTTSVYDTAKKTVVEDFEKLTTVDESWLGIDKSAVVSLDTTGKLNGNNALKAVLKRSANPYNIATINYNVETKFKENYDGVAFTAIVESACEMRVALVLKDYGQVYADVQLTPEKNQYVLLFDEMKSYDQYKMPTDLVGTDFHQMVFQIGRADGETNLNGPDENVLYIDDITLFTKQEGTVPGDTVDTGVNSPIGLLLVIAAFGLSLAVTIKPCRKEKM